jgi:hypothetical protein
MPEVKTPVRSQERGVIVGAAVADVAVAMNLKTGHRGVVVVEALPLRGVVDPLFSIIPASS